MIEDTTNAQTPVEQGPEDPRTAEGAGESAHAEAVPAVTQESAVQAESVAAAQSSSIEGDAARSLTIEETGIPSDPSARGSAPIHSESYAEMQARVEREGLIRPQDGCRFHGAPERQTFDLTMTAKELGFPNVVVRHAAERIGKLDYLDNALAIVTYDDGSTLSVQPCEIEIVPAAEVL